MRPPPAHHHNYHYTKPVFRRILYISGPHAMLLPEILLSVFDSLDSLALARSAQVCRLWSDVALDILWRDLPTLIPLLKLCGLQYSSTPRFGPCGHKYWGFGPAGPRIPEERLRRMYVSRIQSLQDDILQADIDVTHTLKKLSSLVPYLPNLKILHFKRCIESEGVYLVIVPFIVPTIKSLTLPGLFYYDSPSGLPKFRRMLDSLHKIRGLSLEYLDVSGIDLMHATAIEAVCGFVQQQTSLCHLGVALNDTELFASTCNRSGNHPTITSLTFKWPGHQADNLNFMRPLFQFRDLKALDLIGSVFAEMPEQDVVAMASAWPTLLQLRLRLSTLTPLVSIARAFPCLDNLCVHLYRANAKWLQLTGIIPRFYQLRELNLRPVANTIPLETSEVHTLAEVIIAICPKETHLILPPAKKGDPDIQRPCTSLEVITAEIREVFHERPFLERMENRRKCWG